MFVSEWEFVTDKLHTQVSNSFALAVCLEVILWRKFRINNRKSLYFNHGIKSDKKRNLKLKICNAICWHVCYLQIRHPYKNSLPCREWHLEKMTYYVPTGRLKPISLTHSINQSTINQSTETHFSASADLKLNHFSLRLSSISVSVTLSGSEATQRRCSCLPIRSAT